MRGSKAFRGKESSQCSTGCLVILFIHLTFYFLRAIFVVCPPTSNIFSPVHQFQDKFVHNRHYNRVKLLRNPCCSLPPPDPRSQVDMEGGYGQAMGMRPGQGQGMGGGMGQGMNQGMQQVSAYCSLCLCCSWIFFKAK